MTPERLYESTVDAITRGTLDGLTLLLNIVAMLIVIVTLVHLVNLGLGLLPDLAGAPITLERLLGYVMAPVAWLMGIPWSEAVAAGSLLGIKVVLNEFLAYFSLAGLPEGVLGERSRLIMTYALCGFANFASLGILIAGYRRDGAGAPGRDRGSRPAFHLRRHACRLHDGNRGGASIGACIDWLTGGRPARASKT